MPWTVDFTTAAPITMSPTDGLDRTVAAVVLIAPANAPNAMTVNRKESPREAPNNRAAARWRASVIRSNATLTSVPSSLRAPTSSTVTA